MPALVTVGAGLLGAAQIAVPQKDPERIADAGQEAERGAWLADLPANLDMVVVINDATRLRAGRLGLELPKILGDQRSLDRVTEAWSGLARELGWSDDELFDRLMGRRVMLVSRTVGNPAESRWAVLANVTRETETRLRSRLRVSARAMVAGQQVLSLEKGAYELATRAAQRVGDQEQSVEVVLGPAGQSDVFDEMVARPQRVNGGGRPGQAAAPPEGFFGDTPVFERASSMLPADILLLLRPAGAVRAAGSPLSWDRFLVLAASSTAESGNEWLIRIGYRDPAKAEAFKGLEGFSGASFEMLSQGAAATVMQSGSFDDLLTPALPVGELVKQLQLSPEAMKLLGTREVLRAEVLGDGSQTSPRRLAISAAMDVANVSTIAPEMDAQLAAFIGTLERSRNAGTSPPRRDEGANVPSPGAPRDFGGLVPGAVRVLSLEFASPRPDTLLTGGPLTMAWGFGMAGGKADSPGWWSVAIVPGVGESDVAKAEAGDAASSIVRRTLDPLIGGIGDRGEAVGQAKDDDRWLWMLQARPQELEGAIPAILPDYRGIRSALRQFTSVGARLRSTPEGELAGEARFTWTER